MRAATLVRFVYVAAAAVFAGCAGAPSGAGSPRDRMFAMTNRMHAVLVLRPNHGKSWIRPDAGKQWLIYASDAQTGTVYIYNYRVPKGKLFGQITGFTVPYGQCIDKAGDVYIVDIYSRQVSEFAHGGITPIATATIDFGMPIGCGVDRTTGNVAVSMYEGMSGPGGVDVFAGGLNGEQTVYTDPTLWFYWPPAYDPKGNLFVEGMNSYLHAPTLAELPAGSGSFVDLTGLSIGYAAAVQWDGSYIAAVDQGYQGGITSAINRVTVSGSQVTVVRTTQLTDDCTGSNDAMLTVQPFVSGTTKKLNAVISGNIACNNRFGLWNYSRGGNPKRVLPAAIAPGGSLGQSVSPPLKRGNPLYR